MFFIEYVNLYGFDIVKPIIKIITTKKSANTKKWSDIVLFKSYLYFIYLIITVNMSIKENVKTVKCLYGFLFVYLICLLDILFHEWKMCVYDME